MVFFFDQKTAYEMRISDWSSDVCSSDLGYALQRVGPSEQARPRGGVGLPGSSALFARLLPCRQLLAHQHVPRLHVLRQPVAPVGRRGLAADQRFEVAAGGGGDAVAVSAAEAGGHLLLALCDLRTRGGFARSEESTFELPSLLLHSY